MATERNLDYDDLWDEDPVIDTKKSKPDPVAEKYNAKKREAEASASGLFDTPASAPAASSNAPAIDMAELSRVLERIVGEATQPILQRLTAVETQVSSSSNNTDAPSIDMNPLFERIAALEQNILSKTYLDESLAGLSSGGGDSSIGPELEQLSQKLSDGVTKDQLDESLASVNQRIATIDDTLNMISEKINDLRQASNDASSEPQVDRLEISRQIRREMEQEFNEKLDAEKQRMNSQLAVSEERRKKAEEESKTYEEEVTSLTEKLDAMEDRNGTGDVDVEAIKANYENTIGEYEQTIAKLEADLESAQNQGLVVDSSAVDKLTQQLEAAQSESTQLRTDLSARDNELQTAREAEQSLRDELAQKDSQIAQLRGEKEEKRQAATTAPRSTVTVTSKPVVQEPRETPPRRSSVPAKTVTPQQQPRPTSQSVVQPAGDRKLKEMGLKELKQVAEDLGVELPTFVTKGKIIKAILASDRGREMYPNEEQPAKVTSAIPPRPSATSAQSGPVDDEFEKMNYKQLVNKAKEWNVDIGMFAPAPKLRELLRAHVASQ